MLRGEIACLREIKREQPLHGTSTHALGFLRVWGLACAPFYLVVTRVAWTNAGDFAQGSGAAFFFLVFFAAPLKIFSPVITASLK